MVGFPLEAPRLCHGVPTPWNAELRVGHAYQRGNRYWISYRDKKTRKRVRKPAGSSRLEAQRILHRIHGTDCGTPFDTIAEVYLEALSIRAKKQSVAVAAPSLRRLTQFFDGKDMTHLAIKDVNAFIRSRQQDGVKPVTINGDLVTLRAALNFAVEAKLLEKTPVKVKLLRAPKKRAPPILSPQDVRKFLQHAWEPYYGILLVSAHTGLRLDEILHLTWSDVLFQEGKLAVTAKRGWQAKSYEERAVYVPKKLLNYLRRLRLKSSFKGPDDYVFATRNGTPKSVTNTCRGFRIVFQRAGLYQRGILLTHWIRHSVCSRLLGEGVDVETVRQLMGHSEASTTLLYAHSSDARLKAASQALDLG